MKTFLRIAVAIALGVSPIVAQQQKTVVAQQPNMSQSVPATENASQSNYWTQYVKTDSQFVNSTVPSGVKTDFWGLGAGLDYRSFGGNLGLTFPRATLAFEKQSPTTAIRLALGIGLSKSEISGNRILILSNGFDAYGFDGGSLFELLGEAFLRTPNDFLVGVNVSYFGIFDSPHNTSLTGVTLGLTGAKQYAISKNLFISPYAGVSYDIFSSFNGNSTRLSSISGYDGFGFNIGVRSSFLAW